MGELNSCLLFPRNYFIFRNQTMGNCNAKQLELTGTMLAGLDQDIENKDYISAMYKLTKLWIAYDSYGKTDRQILDQKIAELQSLFGLKIIT
jgi:hypothetical protein